MTISNSDSDVSYFGNGVTTVWPFGFIIPTAADAVVGVYEIATGILTPLSVLDYGITGLGNDAGGSVTYPLMGTPLSSAFKIVIQRELEYTQDLALTNQSAYYPETLEGALDRLEMQIQQVAAATQRSVQVVPGSGQDPAQLVADLVAGVAAAEAAAEAAEAAVVGNIGAAIVLALNKATLAANDLFGIVDSADSNNLKNHTWEQLQAMIASATMTLTNKTLILKQSAAPTPTVEGDTQWDTDDNTLKIGDGATTKEFVDKTKTVGRVVIQQFTANGTYTPTAGMSYCIIECIGGGGGGGGAKGLVNNGSGAGGGGSGGYSRKIATAADIGVSKAVTVGTAGAAGASGGPGAGGAGGATSVGTLCVANGGLGGNAGPASGGGSGGFGGVAAGAAGDIIITGASGGAGSGSGVNTVIPTGGLGGAGPFGGSPAAAASAGTGSTAGAAGTVNSGAGGGGAVEFNQSVGAAGGLGGTGRVIITEFLNPA